MKCLKRKESHAGRRGQGRGRGQRTGPGCPGSPVRYCKHAPFLFRWKTGVPRQDSSSCCSVEMGPMGSRRLTDRSGQHTLWPRCHDIMTKDQRHEGPLPGGLAASKGGRRPVAHCHAPCGSQPRVDPQPAESILLPPNRHALGPACGADPDGLTGESSSGLHPAQPRVQGGNHPAGLPCDWLDGRKAGGDWPDRTRRGTHAARPAGSHDWCRRVAPPRPARHYPACRAALPLRPLMFWPIQDGGAGVGCSALHDPEGAGVPDPQGGSAGAATAPGRGLGPGPEPGPRGRGRARPGGRAPGVWGSGGLRCVRGRAPRERGLCERGVPRSGVFRPGHPGSAEPAGLWPGLPRSGVLRPWGSARPGVRGVGGCRAPRGLWGLGPAGLRGQLPRASPPGVAFRPSLPLPGPRGLRGRAGSEPAWLPASPSGVGLWSLRLKKRELHQ